MSTYDIGFLRTMFQQIDPRSKIWSVGEKLSPYLAGTIDIEDEDFGISIIDQFSGKQPLLMSRATLGGQSGIAFHPTVLLDSNVVSYLHEYKTKPDFRKSNKGRVIRKLLEKFIELGCDYNPVFYFSESAAKNDLATLEPYAREMANTMFSFHSMDQQRFLETDEIIPSPEAISKYLEHFGVDNASQMPDAFLSATIFSPDRPEFSNVCDAIYVTLLKMILIHLTSNVSTPRKLEQLRAFFDDELGYQMARELLIATDYFSGNCDRFISLKPGSKWENMKPKLKASAWDILLLRIPEILLASGDHDEAPLGYVCTAESALRDIGKLFMIKAVSCMPPDVTVPKPMIDYDFRRIEEKYGSDITAEIRRTLPTIEDALGASSTGKSGNRAVLSALVTSLEQDVRSLCI